MKRITLFLILFTVSVSYAALPPAYYQELKEKSQEHIFVSVYSVKTGFSGICQERVKAYLDVTSVTESKSGLTEGSRICAEYFRNACVPKFMPGPAIIERVEEKKVYEAYLNKDEGAECYSPAADGETFIEVSQ